MTGSSPQPARSTAAERAHFYTPERAFDRPIPTIPPTVFCAERGRAFAPDAPTGFVPLDQSDALGCDWPATTPTLLAQYLVLRADEPFSHRLQSTGQVYYVIRGRGDAECAGERFAWKQGDAFCLPGDTDVRQTASEDAILLVVANTPELCYLRAGPSDLSHTAIRPTLFLFEDSMAHLQSVHGRNSENLAAGKSVIFLTDLMKERRVTTPTMLSSFNSLEPGGDQRPHKHSSVALTLCIQGDGVYSQVDGVKVPWRPDTVIVTPPNAVHSHHNRGDKMMLSFVVQDTALHAQLRTTNFSWTDG